ncbi:metallophosphoesterase [Patescibacteria group bacterium]
MKIIKIIILLFAALLLSVVSAQTVEDIIVTDADSVWTLDLFSASSDILDSTDALPGNLIKYAFVSHADNVWHSDLTPASPDVLDSTDALEENLMTWAFVSHADSVWQAGLKGEEWIGPEIWSFAIITDLHIGRGYPDYGEEGYDDGDSGQDYYLTERLKKVVNWINENKNNPDYNIKFLVVLGDVADTGEKSESLMVRSILDGLNDPNQDGNIGDGIPYVVVFGNHDVWPHTEYGETSYPQGEEFFEQVFWDASSKNFQLINQFFGDSWKRDEMHKNYKNFVFSYKEVNFIGLDFSWRDEPNSEAEIFIETENWLENKLNEYQGEKPVILLSHHPFTELYSRTIYGVVKIPFPTGNFDLGEIEKIKNIIKEYEEIIDGKQILGGFGGHIHGFEKLGKEKIKISPFDLFMDANWEYPLIFNTPVLTTESLMVGGNEKDLDNKGIIRIVKVNKENNIDFSDVEGKFPALNPLISFDFQIIPGQVYPCVFFKAHIFSNREYSLLWEFGDGNIGSNKWEIHCYSSLKVSQTYNVKLTAIDKETNEKEYITRKVEIKEGIIPKIIKITEQAKEKIELISIELEKKVTEFGRTMKDTILIKMQYAEEALIGLINVHFGQAIEDIDLTGLVADSDIKKKKSILFISQWPDVIEEEKTLFIPK